MNRHVILLLLVGFAHLGSIASAATLSTVHIFSSRGDTLRQALVEIHDGAKHSASDQIVTLARFNSGRDSYEYASLPAATRHLRVYAPGFQIQTFDIPSAAPDQVVFLRQQNVSLLSRAIVGFQQAGASAAEAKWHFHYDLYLEVPLEDGFGRDIGAKWRTWGRTRITSVPQLATKTVKELAADFASDVAKLRVNELAQAIEILGGAEWRILPLREATDGMPEYDMFAVSLYVGGG